MDTDTDTIDATQAPARTGPAVIAGMVKRLPNGPGVYRMIDRAGDVLYVGKARSLRKRVASYARIGGQTNRIARMIAETAAMEFVSTATETEALLLEANLIKRLRPRYNVLMRDDKSFPYILITRDHAAPQIVKHRGARSRKGDYFGPFASAGAVGRTINALQRAFLLRSCSDSVYESRTRPCLLYQIKRCSAPCTGEISLEDYARLVDEAEAFLSGRSGAVREQLARQMEAAAERLDFEQAAVFRDRLSALSHVTSHQGINVRSVEEADVFAVHQEGGQTCIQVFFFRTGQNWGNRAYFPRADRSLTAGEVLGPFIAQFYDDKPVPRLVLLSEPVEEMDLLSQALSLKAGRKVEVAVPRRGDKKDLTDHALSNAKEALGRRLAESASQGRLLAGLAEAFGLEAPPRRVEVYDNSHIMGASAVGAMIVAGPEGFEKGQYRKFNIRDRDLTPGDDFGMMREVLRRRFTRLLKESGRELPEAEGEEDSDAADDTDDPDAGALPSPLRGGAGGGGAGTADPDAGALPSPLRGGAGGGGAGTADPGEGATSAAGGGSPPPDASRRPPRRGEVGAGGTLSGSPAARTAPDLDDAGALPSPLRGGAGGGGAGSADPGEGATSGPGGGSPPPDASRRPPRRGEVGAPPVQARAIPDEDVAEDIDPDITDHDETEDDETEDDDLAPLSDDLTPWPDLVLIDGGPGQLAAARAVMAELGLTDVPLVGIAKGVDRDAGREVFHVPGRRPFRLAPRDPVLYFVQRLRDEAHRFAIGSHRTRRRKAMAANPLDEIPGIGPSRKRALLRHFGSAKAVSRAALADLEATPGISAQMAKTVYEHFHEGGG